MGLFGPTRGPRDFNCARLHRGKYLIDTNQFTRLVTHDFQVIHGDAEVRPGRPISIEYGWEEETRYPAEMETWFIFPVSEKVRVMIEDGRGRRGLWLWKECDRSKSRMYKQRIMNRILRIGDAPPGGR